MKLFADTSALVKYYYPEPDSDVVEAVLLKAACVYVCELAVVELASALMRKIRMREMSRKDKTMIWETFAGDLKSESIEIVNLSADDYFKAASLVFEHGGRHSLRTLDALQIAAAIKIPGARFLTADQSLSKISAKIGLRPARV